MKPQTELDILNNDFLADCNQCDLRRTCTKILPGRGYTGIPGLKRTGPKLLFVGDAPDLDEDMEGEIFAGEYGYVLEMWISYLGLSEKDWYITNIVKCCPPDDRKAKKDEQNACATEWLYKEIKYIDPWIILPVGRLASAFFLGSDYKTGITDYCGKFYLSNKAYLDNSIDNKKRMVYPLLHPTYYINHSTQEKESVWGIQLFKLDRYLKKRFDREEIHGL